jgi:hypothetical protein
MFASLSTALLFVAAIGITALELHNHGLQSWRQLAGIGIIAVIVEAMILVFMLPIIWLAPHGPATPGYKGNVVDYGVRRRRPIGAIASVVYVALFIILMINRGMFYVAFVTPSDWPAERWADWRTALPYYLDRYAWSSILLIGAFAIGYAWTAYVHFRDRRAAHNRPPPLSLDGV